MQSPSSTFRNTALASGLVREEDLALAEESLRADAQQRPDSDSPGAWDRGLADYLCQLGRINAWQAQQLLEGRTRFSLGPYQIIDSIGQGGMGQVFLAEHTIMGRAAAVKVLPRDRSTPEAVAAFHREIRAQAQLDHPNLVRAWDAGHDGNVHYLVTEYVPGIDLRFLIRRDGPLDVYAAAGVISQAASGLEHAHSKGLIHRDVKPGNLLVTDDGQVKLSDLGLVGFFDDNQETDPRYGKIVGTADYLSPEQISEPSKISIASDIYALGCTLYYAVTGKVPFPGGTTGDKCRAHCQLQPLDPRRLNTSLSGAFVDVIAHMMVKDPAQRVVDARQVVERLTPWAGPDPRVPVATARQRESSPATNIEPPPVAEMQESATETRTDLEIGPAAPVDALPVPPAVETAPAVAPPPVVDAATTVPPTIAAAVDAPAIEIDEPIARRPGLGERLFGDIPYGLQLLILLGAAGVLATAIAVIIGLIRP